MRSKKIKLIEPVVGEEEIENIRKVLLSGWLTEGQVTEEFEEKVRQFVGAKYAIATTSCTTALELSLRVLGIGPRDEVIVPDFTHPATGNIVRWIGAKPVLVDVDLFSYNVDPSEIEKAITKKTKCIIPISWGGNPLDMKPLIELKEKHDLFIVEDAACSLGAEYAGTKTGKLADITCFSFHPRKLITTGEGGMAVTNNTDYAEKLASLKKFGMKIEKGVIRFVRWGTNYKISDISSAIGLAQMKKIAAIIDKRIELAYSYNRLFAHVNHVRTPEKRKNTKHVYQTYAVYLEKDGVRDKVIMDLKKQNIETQIGTYALHMQPSYRQVKKTGKLQRAEKLYRNVLAIPMCHSMTKDDQNFVVSRIERSLHAH